MSNEAAALRLDAGGRVLDGDAVAMDFNARAGGRIGEAVAIPGLHRVALASRRFGVPLARSVTASDSEGEWELDVRARPEQDGVRLTLAGWRPRSRDPGRAVPDAEQASADADWRWETDAALRLRAVSSAIAAGPRRGPEDLVGRALSELFVFPPGAEPVSDSLPFFERPVRLADDSLAATISGVARRDAAGDFLGFAGGARFLSGPGSSIADPVPALARSLELALRTPLSRIVADAKRMSFDGALNETYAGYAADIAAAGQHLLTLIDDLADLEAAEQPDLPLIIEAIDLAGLARRAGGLLAVRAGEAEVLLRRPAAEERAYVRGDQRRALQVLLNLIGNALRYSPRGGTVTLTADVRGDWGEVAVADRGRGIAAADHERVFEKFERLDPSEPGGTGLGLYIARRLARAMGGDVTLASVPGEGARFTLRLPADAARGEYQR